LACRLIEQKQNDSSGQLLFRWRSLRAGRGTSCQERSPEVPGLHHSHAGLGRRTVSCAMPRGCPGKSETPRPAARNHHRSSLRQYARSILCPASSGAFSWRGQTEVRRSAAEVICRDVLQQAAMCLCSGPPYRHMRMPCDPARMVRRAWINTIPSPYSMLSQFGTHE